MKKLMLVAIMLVSAFTLQAQNYTLKGYTIGQKTDEMYIKTTVGGMDGYLFFYKLNDGRIYQMIFSPTDEWVFKSDVLLIKTGVEKKYQLTLHKKSADDGSLKYLSDDKTIFVYGKHNQFMDKPYKLLVSFENARLKEIHEQEKQSQANNDF